jgi:hypothetical protein
MQGFGESWILYTMKKIVYIPVKSIRQVRSRSSFDASIFKTLFCIFWRWDGSSLCHCLCINDSRDKHTVQAISVISFWRYFVYSKSSSGNFSLYLHIRMIIHYRTEGDWSSNRVCIDRAMNSDGSMASSSNGWLSFCFLVLLDPMLLMLS